MHTVGCVIFDGVRAFDYAVIGEVWSNRTSRPGLPAFELRVCGPGDGARVHLDGGLERVPDAGLDGPRGLLGCDLVMVPGVADPGARRPPEVLAALRAVHARGIPIASLCAGAFVLAEAGLLDGRRATTHWALAADLAERHPAVRVDPEVLFAGDGEVWTSAGVAAGVDLCLHLVRAAHGQQSAATIARAMVTAPFRTGGQAQFIPTPVPPDSAAADPLAQARTAALLALDHPWTVAELAEVAVMSERSFARRFTQNAGVAPLRWLLEQRVLAAQRLLEETDLPVDRIAVRCGFGSAVSLRAPFVRQVGLAPRDYRRSFRGRERD
ncbi:helix-turn-helix domain-containing protein [Kitasatospora nipponensis]|uniref:Helix-turn-helix domain-containing protein n=1 Tax=Kitasatospora nipponensis TaxID=258049 RepID=A0ABN1WQ11_9ACTN